MPLSSPARCVWTRRPTWPSKPSRIQGSPWADSARGWGKRAPLVLLRMTPTSRPAFWWTFAALIALVAMQVVYWAITHPVNKFWLKDTRLKGLGAGFFSLDPMQQGAASADGSEGWRR